MEKREIPFSPPDITDLEIAEVIRTLKSGWITTGYHGGGDFRGGGGPALRLDYHRTQDEGI